MARKKKAVIEGGVKVRLLQKCDYGEGNDVVTIPADELEAAKFLGNVDDDAISVGYAESLPQNQPSHEDGQS